jgi:hypothetical protein
MSDFQVIMIYPSTCLFERKKIIKIIRTRFKDDRIKQFFITSSYLMSTVSFTWWNKNVCVVIIDLISMQRMFVDWPINMGSFHQMFYFFDTIKFYNIYSHHRWQLIHFIIVIHYIDFSSQMKECKFHFFSTFRLFK